MKTIVIEYDLEINNGDVYYRGTQLGTISLSDSNTVKIKELAKKRDIVLERRRG